VDVDVKTGVLQTIPASIIVAVAAGALCGVFYITDWRVFTGMQAPETTAPKLGEMFLTTYLLPFEIISIVLLVALIGAAMIARKDKKSIELRQN
jgi:NADH-quinone oxidoreductase subunit J